MAKEKKIREKKKKKGRKDKPEPTPIPDLPGNEINRDDNPQQRIPVPPGEMPPLPIYAPAEPGHQSPMFV